MTPVLLLVAAYLIGGIPFGYIIVRLTTGQDVRSMGSGNIGATNVLRTTGRTVAVITLLLDIAKGFVAVWLMAHYTEDSPLWTSAAALAVMAGHAYPIFLKFKGGKAVASFIGAFFYLTPVPLFAVLLVFVIVVAATRYISLGSIIACGTFPFAVWLILHPPAPVVVAALVAGAFIVIRHKANIQRIRAGNENVFRFGGTK
ncbi:MAG TPA: glycerol-3-phosphate 1-O-acyltransferase PlsY [Bryobacteraceae bacterium]|nr:glycerol-3-phosphate 1-O-acyltransferase PlsY [Bryobacteraceae bacterium]